MNKKLSLAIPHFAYKRTKNQNCFIKLAKTVISTLPYNRRTKYGLQDECRGKH